jgi:hypothetical protein
MSLTSTRSRPDLGLARKLGSPTSMVTTTPLPCTPAALLARGPPPRHHHPTAPCATAALPAHAPLPDTPEPQPLRENASSLDEGTFPPPLLWAELRPCADLRHVWRARGAELGGGSNGGGVGACDWATSHRVTSSPA